MKRFSASRLRCATLRKPGLMSLSQAVFFEACALRPGARCLYPRIGVARDSAISRSSCARGVFSVSSLRMADLLLLSALHGFDLRHSIFDEFTDLFRRTYPQPTPLAM